jgi:predicted SprT family Zn-dependent metalloprotease
LSLDPTGAPQAVAQRKRVRRERWEMSLFESYRAKVRALLVPEEKLAPLDLDNDFYWYFRLTELMALAHRTFDEVNAKHFGGRLVRPKIIYCDRSSGGYYNKTQHVIGISLPMTVEFGEPEFFETLLHEIAHIPISDHSPKFYALLRGIGGTGRKAPVTMVLGAKRERYLATNYPVIVRCPSCLREQRYRTRRALKYACRSCCTKYARGNFDERFRFVEVAAVPAPPPTATLPSPSAPDSLFPDSMSQGSASGR